MAQQFSPDSDFASLETPRVAPPRSLAITALARFEFEAGRGNDGTKILMVEWEDDDLTRSPVGSWHVSWDGKKTVLPADERTNEHTRRFYFLLPPGVTIPPVVTLTYEPPPSSASTAKNPDSMHINPLPAIFPPELGTTARTSGKKGVLHTIWAKKRLQVLDKEIKEESKYNLEGVALEMAIREREWIESNFGVVGRSGSSNPQGSSSYPGVPLSPTSPRSPTSGRKLSEKLKGLKLGTSEKDLSRKPDGVSDPELHPLSPESPDVAISSYSSFRNTPVSAAPPQIPTAAKKRAVAHAPPDFIQAQQEAGPPSLSMEYVSQQRAPNPEDELFAKALSPRTPDIPRSPFSFSSEETMPYITNKSNE
ncbi:hypothetical protein FQN54_003703 [Arachnomyces sp. PD_36]|nr:hypothetical protein FQN54_003703 [Arachnomyces sp. PD_36]